MRPANQARTAVVASRIPIDSRICQTGGSDSAALYALSCDSRAEVDAMVAAAAGAGGQGDVREPQDMGFMYIRTFKPADAGRGWVARAIAQFAAIAIGTVAVMGMMLAVTHAGAEHGYTLGSIVQALHHDLFTAICTVAFAISAAVVFALSRSSWAVEFGEANAIDVESMGLYWHFVDIVWIVIFTVVYLLEYL